MAHKRPPGSARNQYIQGNSSHAGPPVQRGLRRDPPFCPCTWYPYPKLWCRLGPPFIQVQTLLQSPAPVRQPACRGPVPTAQQWISHPRSGLADVAQRGLRPGAPLRTRSPVAGSGGCRLTLAVEVPMPCLPVVQDGHKTVQLFFFRFSLAARSGKVRATLLIFADSHCALPQPLFSADGLPAALVLVLAHACELACPKHPPCKHAGPSDTEKWGYGRGVFGILGLPARRMCSSSAAGSDSSGLLGVAAGM